MDDNKNKNTEDLQKENDDFSYVEASGLFKELEDEIVEENAERERKTAETFNELLGDGVTVSKKPRTAQINAANTKITKAELADMLGKSDDDVDIDEANIISAKAFVPTDKPEYKPNTVPGGGTAVKNDATADKKNKKGKKPVRSSGNQNKMNILFIIIMLIGVILFIVAISGIIKASSGGMSANIQTVAVAADIGYAGALFY